MYDNDGNMTTAQISISNIDKEAPVITSCSGKAEGNKTTLNITTNDSDIDKYSFNGNWYKWSGKNITLDGKHQCVTLSFSDKVGNTSNVSCNIEYINDPIPTPSVVSMSNYEFPKVSNVTTKKVLKVLVIEMDPVLSKGTIEGRSCAGITASVCLGQNKSQVINELVNDIESSSHGIIDVQIVKTEKLNEFSTHKNKATLLNGTKDYKLDEDTWLDIMKNGWYGFWDDERVKEFATLKVLGLRSSKIRRILSMQNLWLSIIGIIIGAPLGNVSLNAMINTNGENFDYNLMLAPVDYVIAGIFVMIISMLVSFMFSKRIRKLDMVETLKGVE